MLESEVEGYLKKQVEKAGGLCMKFISPGNNGVPDRQLFHKKLKRPTFVETKAPGKTTRKLQDAVHAELRRYGAEVYVLDTKEKVLQFLQEKNLKAEKQKEKTERKRTCRMKP